MLSVRKSGAGMKNVKTRNLCLLTVSLLTGMTIPALSLVHLSNVYSENSRVVLNLKYILKQNITNKVFFSAGINPSELSHSLLTKHIESYGSSKTQVADYKITSGKQLYYARLAALKAGQIYPSLPKDRTELSLISTRKTQLTYEDWKNLLAMEAKAMTQSQSDNRLGILVGDSLSLWFPQEKLPVDKLWLNQGISGDTCAGVLRRVSVFRETRPDFIYIMVGINDLRKGTTDEIILHNHREIVRKLRHTHPKTIIFLQSILPTRLSTISNTRIRHLNEQLSLIARQEGVYYLNLYDWFADFQGNLRLELTTDGLHLSTQAYDVWRTAIDEAEYSTMKMAGS
ncbi:lipolytic protein G-D-S-L family [Brasilonema octagenarum UFV-E1]|uniref:Lipolytic protein G-D-S-L family n=3 Tax=Scytonemataceae TaxID=1182 RepID=A0A856MBR1_9CYAN|nr:lipolytic protein G-D-S-L family [Brasilonema octagenarum UFV-OR1]QDL07121.1 lipolytic protein G-D-S-L family [Brasilonema sennae CENA114]QDL13485.1 lipolytic protein G-D-S-L family [Brasilonema octagenarum UFV-E1]